MNSTAELLDRVVADLDTVLSGDVLAGLPDGERMDVLRVAGAAFRRVEAVVVETTASADPDFAHGFGCRGQNEVLQRVLRTDVAGATRVGRAADAVRRQIGVSSGERLEARFPALREAMLDGVIGVAGLLAAVGPIDKAAHKVGRETVREADALLAGCARGERSIFDDPAGSEVAQDSETNEGAAEVSGPPATPEDLRQYAQMIAAAMDPDGPEPSDRGAQNQRFLTIGRLRNGLHAIRGNLLPDVAAQLQAIIDAQCNPKTAGPPKPGVHFADSFADSDVDGNADIAGSSTGADAGADAGAGTGTDAGTGAAAPDDDEPFDRRSAAQKRHDALAAALGIAARHEEMPTLGGASPTLVVHVDAKDLAAGTGWATTAGSESPIPVHVAAHTACTGAIQRVLFDEGRIVGISVTDRVFTVHQRRAIIARDRECLIPGCHVPAAWCEIHHVTEHARGGPTHTDNGVPLCWWHHRSLDWSGWEIRMNDGVPEIRGPAWWDPRGLWRTPRPRTPRLVTRTRA